MYVIKKQVANRKSRLAIRVTLSTSGCCNAQNFEVIFLQETHIYQQKDIEIINNEWQGRHYWAYSSYHSAGVGVLFSPRFTGTIDEACIRSDHEGRILQIPINIDDSDIQLLNVYAPNVPKERRNFFDILPEYIKCHTPSIMGGDWNCIENILLDKFGGDRVSDPSARASLQELLRGMKAAVIYRTLNPNDRLVTWYNPGKAIGCRLDRFYVSPDIAKTSQAKIQYFPYSDHDGPVLCFRAPDTLGRGPGYWKLNTSILADPALFPQVRQLWEKWQHRKPNFQNLNVWWDKGETKTEGLMQKVLKTTGKYQLSETKRTRKSLA